MYVCVRMCTYMRLCAWVRVCRHKPPGITRTHDIVLWDMAGIEGGVTSGAFVTLLSPSSSCAWLFVCLFVI